MDLSEEAQNLHESLRFIKNRNESVSPTTTMYTSSCDFDTIDINRINFENNESWLYKPPNNDDSPIRDLNNWLYNDSCEVNDDDYFPIPKSVPRMSQNEFQKNIDTRTFTRPKKRFTRPSIEKFNEEIYGSIRDIQNEKTPLDSFKKPVDSDVLSTTTVVQEVSEPTVVATNPLNFDLSQPSNSYYFENILANSGDIDSFQNMSPPSLVNSMCSSTFANLMESSFIKNDPVLREIRDTDYTETVLLQDSEPPMFQSITESCSSINSDTPENFLKKISFSGTFRKTMSSETDESAAMEKSSNSTINLNMTYEKSKENDLELQDLENIITEDVQEIKSQPNFIGTYRRTPKSNNTFRKSDVKNATIVLNSTFKMSPKDEILDQYSTQTLIKDTSLQSFENKKPFSNRSIIKNDSVEDMKKQLSETVQITDLNRLSYCLDEKIRLDSMYTENNDELNRTVNMKRSSLGCSTGSADSLDRMSSLSNSSRESNKILNMADVDAIVEMQERNTKYFVPVHIKNKYLNEISPVLYIQSDCDTPISRDYYVKELRQYISIDSYGKCLTNKPFPKELSDLDPLDLYHEKLMNFISRYKFIIAFENSVCDDYITEKLWRPLIAGSIPIYLGSPTIEDWLPNNNSAILVKNYKNFREVGNVIKKINKDDVMYESFLEHKLKSKITNNLLKNNILKDHPVPAFECSVCEKLHKNDHRYKKNRRNIYKCTKPKAPEKENTWDQHWEIGSCQSKALQLLMNKNKPYSQELFEQSWKEFLHNKSCNFTSY